MPAPVATLMWKIRVTVGARECLSISKLFQLRSNALTDGAECQLCIQRCHYERRDDPDTGHEANFYYEGEEVSGPHMVSSCCCGRWKKLKS
ncbi:hypothetical protein BC826DRAFT_1032917 [Russula brevipes]|nr:hypothetical protein BC826DRAFT_1032917 [Russula brevipes]